MPPGKGYTLKQEQGIDYGFPIAIQLWGLCRNWGIVSAKDGD